VKTTIHVAPKIFAAAERFARRNGYSRSELYTRALEEYLCKYGDGHLIERINTALNPQTATFETDVKAAAHKLLAAEEW
jgi:metal-responsive CopG/Arc/MetJ family transcriptional regulator